MIEATASDQLLGRTRIRIAFYFFRLEMSSGGAERMLFNLAYDMSVRGHEVHIISWDQPKAQAFYSLPNAVHWHRLGFDKGWRDKVRRTIQLGYLLKQIRSQIFVGFVMSTDKTVYTACLLANVPIVVAERNSPEMYSLKFGSLKKNFYMGFLGLARRIVVQLEAYRNGYPHWLEKRIEVISNPVKPATVLARPTERGEKGWVLLCVARLEDQKNLEVLIQAFSMLAVKFPDWCLRIVGEGSKRESLERLVSDFALTDQVQLHGAVKNIEEEYANAHLFCLPSRWEGFPNALAEAMAHGLPVVGFAECPGVNAIIDDNVDGLLAPGNGDSMTLANAMQVFMADPEKRARVGEQARLLSHRFNPKNIGDQWERILVRAAKRNV